MQKPATAIDSMLRMDIFSMCFRAHKRIAPDQIPAGIEYPRQHIILSENLRLIAPRGTTISVFNAAASFAAT